MALPSSGKLSFGDVNVEIGVARTNQLSLGSSSVRTLFGKPSGAISMSNGYGKSSQFTFNLTSGTDVDLRSRALSAGWDGSAKLIATIPAGNILQASSTGVHALYIGGSFPNGVTLINQGQIIGRGGNGGVQASGAGAGGGGGAGGPAVGAAVAVSINNLGAIYGGGGGGGAGGDGGVTKSGSGSGGGGGGGIGVSSGGTSSGASAGGNGTLTSAGGGGAPTTLGSTGGWGGSGGGYGSAGANGAGSGYGGGAGGPAGNYINGNGNVTWIATGTRAGGVG